MKMKFKGFEFPTNPAVIEVNSSSNISFSPMLSGKSVVKSTAINPTVITGSGTFYGERGEEYCLYLQHLLRKNRAGVLMLPSAVGMDAYLTKFKYKKDTNKNQISYSFEFVENCGSKKETRKFCFTYARAGENAFDIANRCGVSVENIMENNEYSTPFSVREGDKVMLL